MLSEIRGRLADLRQRPYEELQGLPEWSSEDAVVESVRTEITTYREAAPPDPLRIVVQLATEPERFLFLFRLCNVMAEGFEITSTGAVRDLAEEELYYYT